MFHPEILARGGVKMVYVILEEGGGAMCCAGTLCAPLARGVQGHAPPGIFFSNGSSETHSGTFSAQYM